MMRQTRHGLLAAAALAAGLGAGAARADGRMPIDGCTTIDQPGSYILTQNITVTNLDNSESCIVVSADHVTLDLNGFALIGDGTGNGIRNGLRIDGVTVRNGTIANFGDGIDFPATGRCNLQNLRILNSVTDQQENGFGVKVRDTCIIRGNIAAENDSTGLQLGGSTASFAEKQIALFAGNIVRGNRAGLRVESFSVVSGNVVEGGTSSFGDGIEPRKGSLLTGNAIHNNGGRGIQHVTSQPDVNHLAVTNNAVTANDGGGIDHTVSDDDGALVVYNTFRSNPGGNQIGACVNCTIVHNRF